MRYDEVHSWFNHQGIMELSQCRFLSTLFLRGAPRVTEQAFIHLCDRCPSLKSLSVWSCPFLTKEGMADLGRTYPSLCLNF